MRRFVPTAALAVALAGLSSIAFAGPAAADPAPVTMTGASASTATSNNAQLVTFTYTIVTGDLLDATFTTAQDAALPAAATSVKLDGNPVTAAATGANDLSVQLGVVLQGTHRVSFTATAAVSSARRSAAPSSARLTFDPPGQPQDHVDAVATADVNQPDLAAILPADSGETEVAPLGTGDDLVFFVDVRNTGFGPAAPTQLAFDLPSGLAIAGNALYIDGVDAPSACVAGTPATHWVCPIGSIARGTVSHVALDLTTTAHPPVGQQVRLTATAEPAAAGLTDSDSTNDGVTAGVSFTGIAHLTNTVRASAATTVLTHSVTVTITVTNHGPQPAPDTVALVDVDETHFVVTGFDGVPLSDSSLSGANGLGASSLTVGRLRAGRHGVSTVTDKLTRTSAAATLTTTPTTAIRAAASAASAASPIGWNVGTLAPGQSRTARLTLRATSVGALNLLMVSASAAGDPVCVNTPGPCVGTLAGVRAVRAAAPVPGKRTVPIATVPNPDPTAPTLPATGAPSGPGLVMAGLLIGAGIAIQRVGRRT